VLLGIAIIGFGYWDLQGTSSGTFASTVAADEDEALIRALVLKSDSGTPITRTKDSIFSSGITPKSLVGLDEQKKFFADNAGKIREQRPNSTVKTSVQRVVVAKSRDLAYEYSTFQIEWDADGNKRIGFDGSSLRVWRKVDDEWLEEAFFARPHDDPKQGDDK